MKKRSFASEDGRDRVLRPPLDVFGPLEGARGSGPTDLVSTLKKNLVTSKALWKMLVEASRSTEGALQMAASPNHSIFKGSCATARIASYLQCRRPRGGIIPGKNEGILCREASAERRSEDGAFSPSWGVPWGPPRPPKEVLKIRGGHQSRRQLESVNFYSVPCLPR